MIETTPLRFVADVNGRVLPETTNPDREICYIEIGAVGRGHLVAEPESMLFGAAPSRARRILRTGDCIVSTVRTYLRAVAPVGPDLDGAIASTGFAVLTPGPHLHPAYLGWVAQSGPFIEDVVARSIGVSYPAINPSVLGQLVIPTPGLTSQRAIADYLDAETARIDALIAKKRHLLVLLDQREASLFEAAARRSGFEFPTAINADIRSLDLPASWEVLHLSVLLEQLTNGFVGPTRDILVEEGVRYVQSLHIKRGRIDFQRRPFHVTAEWHRARPRTHLREGDVLIVQTGDIGQVAVVPRGFGEASCHALQIARVRPHLISGEFLGQYLRSHFGYQSLLSRATGALHPHLEGGIRDVPVLVPPLSEQSEILMEIADRRAHIEAARAPLTRQIDLLVEHRQALITAAVTGELEIPGVAA